MWSIDISPLYPDNIPDVPEHNIKSISKLMPWSTPGQSKLGTADAQDDLDLWLAFLTETGIMQASDITYQQSCE